MAVNADYMGVMYKNALSCINVRSNDKPGFVVGSYLSRRSVATTLERSMCAD